MYIAVYRELSPFTGVTILENPLNGKTMMCKAKECVGGMGSGVPKTVWEEWVQGYQRHMKHDTKHDICVGVYWNSVVPG